MKPTKSHSFTPEQIAEVAHEANRGLTRIIGDVPVQPEWDACSEDMKVSAIKGVARVLVDPGITSAQLHWEWMRERLAAGWKWGPKRDDSLKEHPAMVAWAELPVEVRKKDSVFRAIVVALS